MGERGGEQGAAQRQQEEDDEGEPDPDRPHLHIGQGEVALDERSDVGGKQRVKLRVDLFRQDGLHPCQHSIGGGRGRITAHAHDEQHE